MRVVLERDYDFRVTGCVDIEPSSLRKRQSSYTQVRVMRLLLIGFISALAALALLTVAQIAYESSSERSGREKEAEAESNQINFEGDSQSEGSKSWYTSLIKPIYSILGLGEDGTATEGTNNFKLIKQGYVNYKLFSPSSESYRVNQTSLKSPLPDDEYARNQHIEQKLTRLRDRSGQLIAIPTDNTVIQIDKIKGIEMPLSVSRTRKWIVTQDKGTKSGPRQVIPHGRSFNGNYAYSKDMKCLNNKYDRLIAQKLSLKEISRPVITSDGKFDNPFPTWKPGNFLDFIEFMLLEADDSGVPKDKDELNKLLPLLTPNFTVSEADKQNFRVTWIGHSTLVIQIDGFNIITDPVFSDRASPIQFLGPKRIREPACSIDSLPPIDIVLISHDHFDHLDSDSVNKIYARFGDRTRWIVPLGLGQFLRSGGIRNIVELDWWQKDCYYAGTNSSNSSRATSSKRVPSGHSEDRATKSQPQPVSSGLNSTSSSNPQKATRTNRLELDIYLTPAQHWCGRGINDWNKSLWGSYTLVSSTGSTFFFTGDTGYCYAFKEISKIFGPFTGAAIPIGAYKPRWFLRPQHVDPEEAVQIHKDLRSTKSIAIHHSTFVLSTEFYKEPENLLNQLMGNMTTEEHQGFGPFVTLKHGESTEFAPVKENKNRNSR